MRVGMVGLGRMGAGMAANLLQGGHEVVVYNRTPAKAEALIGQGAKAVADVSDACRRDAVVTMLANDSAVEGIVLGGGGVIDSLPAGALHVSSSTIALRNGARKLPSPGRAEGMKERSEAAGLRGVRPVAALSTWLNLPCLQAER